MTDVTEFYKLLVEWAGMFMVDDEYYICDVESESPVMLRIGKRSKPIMVLHEEMPSGDHTFFNPLVETIGHSVEKRWYVQSVNTTIQVVTHKLIRRIIELSTGEEELDYTPSYDELGIVKPYVDKVDEKMLKELDKLAPKHLLRLVYSPRKKIAQLQTELYDDAFLKKLKWRKKTINIIREIFADLLGTDNVHEEFKYNAKEANMSEIESIINIMTMYSGALSRHVEVLLKLPLFAEELGSQIKYLKEYRKKSSWAVVGSISNDKEQKKEEAAKRKSSSFGAVEVNNGFNPPSSFSSGPAFLTGASYADVPSNSITQPQSTMFGHLNLGGVSPQIMGGVQINSGNNQSGVSERLRARFSGNQSRFK